MIHGPERLQADFRHAVNALRTYRKARGLPIRRASFKRTTQRHCCFGPGCATFVHLKDGAGKRLGTVTIAGYSPTELYTSIETRRGPMPRERVVLP
jgi:hypothetical protein